MPARTGSTGRSGGPGKYPVALPNRRALRALALPPGCQDIVGKAEAECGSFVSGASCRDADSSNGRNRLGPSAIRRSKARCRWSPAASRETAARKSGNWAGSNLGEEAVGQGGAVGGDLGRRRSERSAGDRGAAARAPPAGCAAGHRAEPHPSMPCRATRRSGRPSGAEIVGAAREFPNSLTAEAAIGPQRLRPIR